MSKKVFCLTIALALAPLAAFAGEDPKEVADAVAAIKANNPDLKALCAKGEDGIRSATKDAIMSMVFAGDIKGDPRAVGTEAGQTIGRECKG